MEKPKKSIDIDALFNREAVLSARTARIIQTLLPPRPNESPPAPEFDEELYTEPET